MKTKREDLSKEKSGHIALNKHFDILDSYTLESSYDIEKWSNRIPATKNEWHGGRIFPPRPFSFPRKYLIEHSRDVSKTCTLADIDILPGQNPFPCLNQSIFLIFDTLRNYLKYKIRNNNVILLEIVELFDQEEEEEYNKSYTNISQNNK